MAMGPLKRWISRPANLPGELEEQARPLWKARRTRLKKQLRQLQSYWSQKAKEKRIRCERDLERYLRQ
jgi:hypothetical protein